MYRRKQYLQGLVLSVVSGIHWESCYVYHMEKEQLLYRIMTKSISFGVRDLSSNPTPDNVKFSSYMCIYLECDILKTSRKV